MRLEQWRIYSVEQTDPAEARQTLVCVHFVFNPRHRPGYSFFTASYEQLVLFSRDIRNTMTPDERLIDEAFPLDMSTHPSFPIEPKTDGTWPAASHDFVRLSGIDFAPIPSDEDGETDYSLTVETRVGNNPGDPINTRLSKQELLKMAAFIKQWLAPDVEY